jgi:hypothetical protein
MTFDRIDPVRVVWEDGLREHPLAQQPRAAGR